MVVWRIELYTHYFTKRFGNKKAFLYYKIGFSILFASRFILITILAYGTQDTIYMPPFLQWFALIVITFFSGYLFYSVKRYFGIDRAYGIDHFDPNFHQPFVKKGIYKYSSNAMYIFGLSVLYIPGFFWSSVDALVVAFFHHLYIWVHYFCTELPDIKTIYKQTPK